MNPQMFRAYDIRGVAGTDLTADDVVLIGKGLGTYLRSAGATAITVGRDCRLTSDEYAGKLIRGLVSTGCRVTDIGICPTPVLYFSIHHLKQDGGVMVTASHNPAEYNGFKMCRGLDSIHGDQIQEIFRIIESRQFTQGEGDVGCADVLAAYRDYILGNVSLAKPLRVGVDAGNGTAGVVAVPLIRDLGCDVHDIYCEMDGTFPNHEADPTVAANMVDLIGLVKEKKLDLGIGYDGDGDRIGVVDHGGNIIYCDKLMIIFAREILLREPGATFIADVKCSQTLYSDIEAHGGKAIMWKTGHSLMKAKLKAKGAALAGEMSGHVFFADRYFGYDDAAYASARLLEILAATEKTIPELLADVPGTYSTPEIRVEYPDDTKFEVVEAVTERFRNEYEVIDIDGMRVVFEDGWGLVRASNTQPALVLRFEALTEQRLVEIRMLVESTLEDVKKSF